MTSKRRAQLNAISRSYTKRGQAQALASLRAMGIDFEEYRQAFGYKASPCRLLTSLSEREPKATANADKIRKA